jgi:FtsZ-binding cell division protein ZapB
LAELRDNYERQIAESREEFNRHYEAKVKALQDKLDQERIKSSGNVQDVYELQTKVTGLVSRNTELESMNASFNQRLDDLLKQLDDTGKMHRNEMAQKVTTR